MTVTATSERFAEVVTLPTVDVTRLPRELRFRAYPTVPPAGQPIARVEHRIEQQLDDKFELGLSPYGILRHFAPAVAAEATAALDALFDAADDVCDAEAGRGDGTPLPVLYDQHGDALYRLAQILRGAR